LQMNSDKELHVDIVEAYREKDCPKINSKHRHHYAKASTQGYTSRDIHREFPWQQTTFANPNAIDKELFVVVVYQAAQASLCRDTVSNWLYRWNRYPLFLQIPHCNVPFPLFQMHHRY